ncbi:MAG: spore protease YyaC [Firmicutes bacterium]|nr:spore protease YyaC [Bacillota bacterium]
MTNPDKIFKALSFLMNGFARLPVVLCAGTDRVTGDCFGPLVGEDLVRRHNAGVFVYGTLSAPVTAKNLVQALAFIKERHPHSPILAVDSALGDGRDIGSFKVFDGGLFPGAAAGKLLPKIGDFSLTATVAPKIGAGAYGVRLGLVAALARVAALTVARCVSRRIHELNLLQPPTTVQYHHNAERL